MIRMELTDQKYSFNTSSEQEVIRYMKKLAQIFGLNEQNVEVYSIVDCAYWPRRRSHTS